MEYSESKESKDLVRDISWLEVARDKSILERLWDSAYRIFIGFVLLLSCKYKTNIIKEKNIAFVLIHVLYMVKFVSMSDKSREVEWVGLR
jgi:hypothetical protein